MARKATEAPAFDEFWALYPVHKDRKRAEQAWQRLTAGDRRAALAALPGYTRDCQQQGIQFKYAQGWLNGRRWEDELEQEIQVPGVKFQVPSGAAATEREHSAPQGPETLRSTSGRLLPTGRKNLNPETNGTSPIPPVGMEKW